MRGRTDRHLAASAHLVEANAERIGHRRFVQIEQAPRRCGPGQKAEKLCGKPAFNNRPIRYVDRGCHAGLQIHAARKRGDKIPSADCATLFSHSESDEDRCDAWVTAPADVIIIQHVTQAAVHKGRPWCGSLSAKAENGALRLAAQISHVLHDEFGFRCERTRPDRHAQGIKHALLGQFDKSGRQVGERQACEVAGNSVRGPHAQVLLARSRASQWGFDLIHFILPNEKPD